jgi:ABC-type spermidine/putrescine transport system permease subunit I
MLTDNLAAALLPGGTDLYIGQVVTQDGVSAGVVHLSNGMGLAYLAVVAVLLCVLAALLLRRRDL